MNKPLLVILAAVTLDAVGIGLVFPIMPALLRDVSHSGDVTLLYGFILAIYAAMQFLFSPILGLLSDRFGRRPVLLLSLAGAAVDYVMMALTPHLWVLVLGRGIAGITSANMAVATAYLSDISAEDERARRFGYMHACFGLGFILGPLLGGVLGDIWVRYPFLLAALLNAINFAFAYFVLPESRPGTRSTFKLGSLNPLASLGWAFKIKALLPFMAIYVAFNFIGQIYATIWTLFGEDRFGWSATMVGLSLGGFGVCLVACQALLVGPVTRWLGERGALFLGIAFEGTACLLLAFANQTWMVFVLLPLFALGAVGTPALQSLATRTVSEDQQGQLQGVLASLVSLTAILAPIFYTEIYFRTRESFSGTVWLICVGLFLACIPIIAQIGKRDVQKAV